MPDVSLSSVRSCSSFMIRRSLLDMVPKLDVAEAIVDVRGVVCFVERKYGSKVYWRWRSERCSTLTKICRLSRFGERVEV